VSVSFAVFVFVIVLYQMHHSAVTSGGTTQFMFFDLRDHFGILMMCEIKLIQFYHFRDQIGYLLISS
jgi:hypothetical protein